MGIIMQYRKGVTNKQLFLLLKTIAPYKSNESTRLKTLFAVKIKIYTGKL
jgi:hypothetical protein